MRVFVFIFVFSLFLRFVIFPFAICRILVFRIIKSTWSSIFFLQMYIMKGLVVALFLNAFPLSLLLLLMVFFFSFGVLFFFFQLVGIYVG